MENKNILFVMGNGSSLKEIMDNPEYLKILKENDTFGLNSAYRAYEKYNFYPTYFGCFDYLVNESHKTSFENLVLTNNPIKEFYFIGSPNKKQDLFCKEVRKNKRFKIFNFINVDVEKYKGMSIDFDNYYNIGSSGANAVQVGIIMGYKKIILLGCDCNYVERVTGAVSYDNKEEYKLELTENLSVNPNYWFPEYQIKGDRFNLPGTDRWQMGSWKNLSSHCPKDVKILNCSRISQIPYFEFEDFKNIK
jgi:hypothetical protein